jgi:hypothetical protein
MCIGKNVSQVPTKVSQKLTLPSRSSYIRPVTFGNQKYIPPSSGKTAAPKMMKWKWATTKYVSVTAWSNGMAANMIPESPPVTKSAMKPPMKSSGVANSGVPMATVVVQAKIWIVLGMTTISVAPAKKIAVAVGMPRRTCGAPRRRSR